LDRAERLVKRCRETLFSHSVGLISADQGTRTGARSEAFRSLGRKLELTPQGEIFYVEARKVLNSVEEAKEKTKNHAAHFSGKISLAAPACRVISICRASHASARTLSLS
jgi:hypothetical protein